MTGTPLFGGVGGNGGDSGFGGGGGGGAGGYGAVVTGAGAIGNASALIGGDGGNGGNAGLHGSGGNGGDGGIGVQVTMNGTILTNSGSFTGGNGGIGGFVFFGGGGNGGNGGIGALIEGNGATFVNTGIVGGGNGGKQGASPKGGNGIGGSGGVGVQFSGSQATFINSGTVIGGSGGVNISGMGLSSPGSDGGVGVSFVSNGATLSNFGTIVGGTGGGGMLRNGDGVAGVLFKASGAAFANFGMVTGGNGSGGNSSNTSGRNGGAGGIAAQFNASEATFANSGSIAGGNGGSGGGNFFAGVGDGGPGGIAVQFGTSGATFTNYGKVTGGTGGSASIGASGPGLSGAGGVGIVGNGLAVVNSGAISGGLSGDGLTRANAITFTGGTNVLELWSRSTIVGNVAAFGAGDSLRLGGSGNASFDVNQIGSQYTGFGNYQKIGNGAWTLIGTNTLAMPWKVQDGVLAINGSITNAAFTVVGGILGGNGTVFGIVVQRGGTVAPGVLAPYSTLSIAGAASFEPGSIFIVNVNAAGQNDKLVSGGATNLSGASLQVVAAGGSYTPSTRYTLITAAGGLHGAFASFSTTANLAFLSPTVTYDANDVYLGFVPRVGFSSVALTVNQFSTATALQAQPAGSTLYDAMIGQTASGARQAFNALSGEIHASAMSAAVEDMRLPREAVLDRLTRPYGAFQANGSTPFMASADFGAKDLTHVWATWGQAFGSSGHISGDGNAAYLNDSLAGFIFGADATIDSHYRFGVAASYTHSDLSDPQRYSSGRIDSTSIGFYGGTSQQALQLRGGAFYTFNRFNTMSNVAFPGFYTSDSSGYNGNIQQAFGEAGWRVALPDSYSRSSWVEPFAGMLGMRLNTDSFSESGFAAALNGASGGYGFAASTLGVRAEGNFLESAPVTFHSMLGWRYVFGALNPAASLAFASAPTVPFTVYGAPIARNALAAEVGADWRVGPTAVLGIYYSGLIGGGTSDNAVKGKFEMAF
ncbi:autotransporter domain-containing protein [Rhodoblastus sp. 17X3]|uniref:autotransporter outer membrane beta-barrel domain-containing protein n=1 Tax=Rhodoblastus sp. 17X3 TaxID=3047026 RepID=UPI0024B81FBC|nr:autotransporter domain-containing protein [Rhodoblastus sp. 17X3]MDI9849151.1 autotransporter domain-containing protein [Rhodoblastus sp. 17X3]